MKKHWNIEFRPQGITQKKAYNKVIHINLITKTFKIASEYKHIKLACTLHWH
jgi:hypothetical protein